MSEKYGGNSENDIEIRAAKRGDMVAVAGLIKELADFENMPEGPKISASDLEKDGFHSDPPAFWCLVAVSENNGKADIVGFALYFRTYSTWEGTTMKLEDLYVKQSHRHCGIGGKLFNAVAKEATSSNCSRLDFHVLDWNDVRAFYERKGAVNLTKLEQWSIYRLSGEALQAAANSHRPNLLKK